jgi:hypothetical protein
VTVTADEAMQNAGLEDAEPSHREEIAAWLLDLLSTTRLNSQEVQSEAKRAGFAWRSVHRAAKEAGVLMKREGFGRDTMTYWSLAPLVPTGPTPATADKVA